MPRLDQPARRWRDAIRRIEDLGYATVSISDHFTRGWIMEPVVAMTVAAEVTERLRVLSLVLGNNYRHPVLVHKAMATLDVLSGGRVEVGLGAGWLQRDYQAAGMPLDPPGARIDRLGGGAGAQGPVRPGTPSAPLGARGAGRTRIGALRNRHETAYDICGWPQSPHRRESTRELNNQIGLV